MKITKKNWEPYARTMITAGIAGALVMAGSDILLKAHMIEGSYTDSKLALSIFPWAAFGFILAVVIGAIMMTAGLRHNKSRNPVIRYNRSHCAEDIITMIVSGACFAFMIKIINILPSDLSTFDFIIDLLAIILGGSMLDTFIDYAFRYIRKRSIRKKAVK